MGERPTNVSGHRFLWADNLAYMTHKCARYHWRMARPCKIDTVEFQRKLSDVDREILLTAGAGDLTRGFRNLLSIYAQLHNAGFRADDDVIKWMLSENHSRLD